MTRFEPGSFDNATLVEVIRVNESLEAAEAMLRTELARLREGLETQRLLAARGRDPRAARGALRAQVAAIEEREDALQQLLVLRERETADDA
ncbi:MAG: hypothetical protein AAF515_12590 [Pseudomonadota bacterium]